MSNQPSPSALEDETLYLESFERRYPALAEQRASEEKEKENTDKD